MMHFPIDRGKTMRSPGHLKSLWISYVYNIQSARCTVISLYIYSYITLMRCSHSPAITVKDRCWVHTRTPLASFCLISNFLCHVLITSLQLSDLYRFLQCSMADEQSRLDIVRHLASYILVHTCIRSIHTSGATGWPRWYHMHDICPEGRRPHTRECSSLHDNEKVRALSIMLQYWQPAGLLPYHREKQCMLLTHLWHKMTHNKESGKGVNDTYNFKNKMGIAMLVCEQLIVVFTTWRNNFLTIWRGKWGNRMCNQV